MELEFCKKVLNLAKECHVKSATVKDKIIIVRIRESIYLFDENKILKNYVEIQRLALMVNNLNRGISFNQMNELKSGDEWTNQDKYMEYLTALLYATNLIQYTDVKDDINNPKLKLLQFKDWKINSLNRRR